MPEIQFKTLRQEVANAIRCKILEGEYRPGQRIVEQDIARELGVSRGPVREALREIERDGLIEYARNIGCSVKTVTDDDVFEIYLLRATYEIMSVRLCGGVLNDSALKQMKASLDQMELIDADNFDLSIACDNAFHGAIMEQTFLPRLRQLWAHLNPGNVITYYSSNSDRLDMVKRQFKIHKPIYEAFLKGDAEIICAHLMEHYMLTIKRRLREKGSSIEQFCEERSITIPK